MEQQNKSKFKELFSFANVMLAVSTTFFLFVLYSINYSTKVHETMMVVKSMVQVPQLAVELCVEDTKDLTQCSQGQYGIPENKTNPYKYISSVTTNNGIVTVTTNDEAGDLSGGTFILRPVLNKHGDVKWFKEGSLATVISTYYGGIF